MIAPGLERGNLVVCPCLLAEMLELLEATEIHLALLELASVTESRAFLIASVVEEFEYGKYLHNFFFARAFGGAMSGRP